MIPHFGAFVAGCLVLAAPASARAQSSGVDRRPCVAPGSPYGCDGTMKGAPTANGSLPDMPNPDQRERQTIAKIPLSPPPTNASTKTETTGEVSVKPVPPDTETAPPPRAGVGPQPTSR